MPKHPGSLQLQPRDIELLRGLFESRLMTIAHAAEIHFGGKRESAKKRIQRLKAAGFVRERPRKPYEPSILHLAQKGVTSLSDRGILTEYPSLSRAAINRRNRVSELTLRHELQIMDIKAALYNSTRGTREIQIQSFCTWPRLNAIAPQSKAWAETFAELRPDGVIRASVNKRTRIIYLEVDRSTEGQSVLANKAARYAATQTHLRILGPSRIQHEQQRVPRYVHFVAASERRKRNIESCTFHTSNQELRMFRISTISEVLKTPRCLLE